MQWKDLLLCKQKEKEAQESSKSSASDESSSKSSKNSKSSKSSISSTSSTSRKSTIEIFAVSGERNPELESVNKENTSDDEDLTEVQI